MGIFCEINIHKPEDGVFLPGDIIAGVIKYGFDEDTEITDIIISLKGSGLTRVTKKIIGNEDKDDEIYEFSEVYVDEDCVIKNKEIEENIAFARGMYEARFNFKLPLDIPPSLEFLRHGHNGSDEIRCFIVYYIRIKFDRPGFFKFAKRFKKVITVGSGIKPTLSMEHIICGEKKNLNSLFSRKERVIHLKATVENCVISKGGQIKFNCEVNNFTNITIKTVKHKLVEAWTFGNPKYHGCKHFEKKIEDTTFRTGAIQSGETQEFEFEINVPEDKTSLENSTIVSRKYIVVIDAILPIPHRNVVLKIPVQIGDIIREDGLIREIFESDLDAPPTYWEAMAEDDDKKYEQGVKE